MKKTAITAVILMLFGPTILLLSVAVLMNPAAAACATGAGTGIIVGNIPDQLRVTTANGEIFTLNRQQLTHAATIITVGGGIEGVGRPGVKVALMAALTESTLRMLTNTGAYPESANYPNDGNGGDHDSLGLFQMRPRSGWGTVAELMDSNYQARAFFGGPGGPNYPSPRGLLDIPGWQQMDPGEAAQAVEVSAFPDRYRNYAPVADRILDTLTGSGSGAGRPEVTTAESSRVVFPLPEGTWVLTSPFGMRTHPITGERKLHTGTDFSAPDGTPILAAADGTVTVAEFSGGYGGLIVIEHTINSTTVATAYAHMWQSGIHVQAGDRVRAGQHIGNVGSSGMSTGPHLHFEVRPGGTHAEAADAAKWLNDHHAANLPEATVGVAGGCVAGAGGAPVPFTGDPDQMVDDPTSNGQITARMAYIMAQAKAAFPDTGWGCYSPRPGTKSEHPLGRACDITFGNRIGQRPTAAQLEAGWKVTNWMKDHADVLGVEYLIWQGKVWSVARADQGWRPYNGGGMHDPASITGGHYDHLHVTAKSGV